MLLSNVVKKYYLILIFAPLLAGCSTDAGKLENIPSTFNQNPTYELRIHEGFIYAGTDSGLFRKPVAATEWESLGLGDASIRTLLVFNDQNILASADYGAENDRSTIAKTTDGGQSWFSFRNGYSRDVNKRVPRALAADPSDPNILFAGGPGSIDIAKSTDKGNSWKLVLGNWEHLGGLFFIKIDPNDPNIIWAGGTRAILADNLLKSPNGGQTWQGQDTFVLPNAEANINDLVIKPGNSDIIVAGLEGAVSPSRVIRKSIDGGANWRTVYNGINTRSMAHSARNPETIYASGLNATSTLFFAQSTDFGDSWQQVEVPGAPGSIRVNDMVSVMAGGQEVLYFATNKGVYSYNFEE